MGKMERPTPTSGSANKKTVVGKQKEVVFFAYFKGSKTEHHRVMLVKDGKTSVDDFYTWIEEERSVIETVVDSLVVVVNCNIIR